MVRVSQSVPALLLVGLLTAGTLEAGEPADQGGGEWVLPPHAPHLTASQRESIRTRLANSEARLLAEGKIGALPKSIPPLSWPVAASPGFVDYGFHGISNFVDLDPESPDALLDYNCGERTYDLDNGYDHAGIDIFLWPFSWNLVDDEAVEVVAAAPGTILDKDDGNFDRSCSFGGSWNAVYVRHADGSVAWYGHMKEGSLTPKDVGESVDTGERLGIVASSGSSTGPHLHFELYDSEGDLTDPWLGPCNPRDGNSGWIAQRPYYDSAVNHLATGSAPPDWQACPGATTKNEQDVFAPGETVYVLTYYRDQLLDQESEYTVYRPDGTPYASWTHASSRTHYAASWWYWNFPDLTTEGPPGDWRFEVSFEGETYEHVFTVTSVPAGDFGDSLRVRKDAGPVLELSWGPSCRIDDTGFAIYEGALDAARNHGQVACPDGTLGAHLLLPGDGDRFFLVVPTSVSSEGSYGRDSFQVERAIGNPACRAQDFSCP